MKKRLLSALLVIVMLVSMLPTFALAAETAPAYTLSLVYGNVTVSGTNLVGYDTNGTQVSIPLSECTRGNVVVTGDVPSAATEGNRFDLTVPGGYDVYLTLKGVKRVSSTEGGSDGIVLRGGKITFLVDGENRFTDNATYSVIAFGGTTCVFEGVSGKTSDVIYLQHGVKNINGKTTGTFEIKNCTLAYDAAGATGYQAEGFTASASFKVNADAQLMDGAGTLYAGEGGTTEPIGPTPDPEPVLPENPAAPQMSATGEESTWINPQSSKTRFFLPSNADYKALYFPKDVIITCADGSKFVTTGEPVDLTALLGVEMVPGVEYNVTLNDKTYKVMKSANIGSMFIDLDGDNLETFVHANKENEATGKMVFIDAEGNVTKDNVPKFKGRGNHTWSLAKKPYNFNTESKHTLTGGTKTKKYSLLANMDDSSLIRSQVGLDLADKLNVGLGSQVPVDLWVDGKYYGNYTLTIKNDSEAPDPGWQVEIDNNYEPSVESGGDPQFTLNNWKASGYPSLFTVKSIDGYEPADAQAKLQVIWDAICDQTSDDYMQYIDMETWATFYLFQEFIRDGDPVSGSKLMRWFAEEDKLYGGPAWDLAYSMGRTTNNGRSGNLDIRSASGWWVEALNVNGSYWIQEMGKHASFMEEVYKQYNLHKADFDAVAEETAAWQEVLAPSAALNYAKWSLGSGSLQSYGSDTVVDAGTAYEQTYLKTDSWEDYVANLETYARVRAQFLADNIIDGEVTLAQNEDMLVAETTCTDEALTYTWYANGEAVEGATGATLAAADYDGMTVSVAVAAEGIRGTLTSNEVTVESGEDSKAAKAVDALIDAIGEVTLESRTAINTARAAYEALTAEQKALVTKLAVLEAAEAAFDALKPEVTAVTVALSGAKEVNINEGKPVYTVSVADTVDFATATVSFEADAAAFSKAEIAGVNGFEVLLSTSEVVEGKLVVSAILYSLKGLTSAEAVDIAALTLTPAVEEAETTVTLTGAVLSRYDGTESEAFVEAVMGNTAVTTKLVSYSIYDVNRDGNVDQLDMTRAQRYFGKTKDDEGWYVYADVDRDGEVTVDDLVLILNNFTDLFV